MKAQYAAGLILTGFLVSSHSLADVIPQTMYGPCGGKKPGDDCTTDRGAPGVCNDVYWPDGGPIGKVDERYPPRGAELLCNTRQPRFSEVIAGPLIFGFGVSAVMVGTGLFIVLRRRKRLGS